MVRQFRGAGGGDSVSDWGAERTEEAERFDYQQDQEHKVVTNLGISVQVGGGSVHEAQRRSGGDQGCTSLFSVLCSSVVSPGYCVRSVSQQPVDFDTSPRHALILTLSRLTSGLCVHQPTAMSQASSLSTVLKAVNLPPPKASPRPLGRRAWPRGCGGRP